VLFFVIAPFYFKIGVASFKAIDWTFSLCYHFFGFHSGAFFSWLLNLLMPLQKFLVAHLAFAVSWFLLAMGSWRTLSALILLVVKNQFFVDSRFYYPKNGLTRLRMWRGTPWKKIGHCFEKNKKASNYLRNLAFSGFATHIVFKRKRASFTNTKVDNMFYLFHTQ